MKQLKKVAEEMIKVMDLQDGPAGDKHPITFTDESKEEDYLNLITTAINWIEPTDNFSFETKEALREIAKDLPDVPDFLKPQEDIPQTLEDEINSLETLKELKNLATVEKQFKAIRGKLSSYKTADALKEEMLWMLKDIPDKLHQKLEDTPIQTSIENFENENVELAKEMVMQNADTIANIPDKILFGKDMTDPAKMTVDDIVTVAPFNALFDINDQVLASVTANIKKNGYDPAFPVVLWGNICIDGHTRLKAAKASDLKTIPVLQKEFKDEQDALNYAIHNQRDRRNISDAELLRCIAVIDEPMTKKEVATKGGKSEGKSEPTHVKTAKALGISPTKVTDARTVLADEEKKEEVLSGKKSINKAVTEIKNKRKPSHLAPETRSSRIDAVCQVIKDNKGEDILISDIIVTANELFGKSSKPATVKAVEVVLEVLGYMQLITFVDSETIKINLL
jgi:hypothetical protein